MTRRTFFVCLAAAIVSLMIGLFASAPSTGARFQDTKSGKVGITFDIPPAKVTPAAPTVKTVETPVMQPQKEVVNDPPPTVQPSIEPSISPSQSAPMEEPTLDTEKEVNDSEGNVSE